MRARNSAPNSCTSSGSECPNAAPPSLREGGPRAGLVTLLVMQVPPPDSPAATAARVWPCAQLLAELLPRKPATVAGLSVLELGAGHSGTAGLAAWRAGAARVRLTELPENTAALERAVHQSCASSSVTVAALDWTRPLPADIATARFDVILAADCVYWPALFEPLLSTLAALCKDGHAVVILAAADRQGRAQAFLSAASEAGWASTRLEWAAPARRLPDDSMEALRRKQCLLYELRRARSV
jgi:predicted nicotinamide N-methyase